MFLFIFIACGENDSTATNLDTTQRLDTPSTITDLFEKSSSGEIEDVTYIVVGDSTRYYKELNNVLINSRDSDEGYYKNLLSLKNIKFSHTAMAGQRVDLWLGDSNRDGNKFLISDTLNKIKVRNPNHCIVEFSMGINDALRGEINNVKANIKKAIAKLKATGAKILLVSPTPYYKYNSNSIELNNIYDELKDELNLPFVSGYNILYDEYPSNSATYRGLHPNEGASKKLVDEIMLHIKNNNL